jgi:hypothetical protein
MTDEQMRRPMTIEYVPQTAVETMARIAAGVDPWIARSGTSSRIGRTCPLPDPSSPPGVPRSTARMSVDGQR